MTAPKLAQWTNRTEIRSGTSSRIYVMSEKVIDGVPSGLWACSCPGCITHGNCKHLKGARKEPVPRAPRVREPISAETFFAGTEKRARKAGFRFSDAAYAHYDTSQGFGSADDWLRSVEDTINGAATGTYKPRTKTKPRTPMQLLGLAEMPEDAAGLKKAFRKQAMKVHPDQSAEHRSCPVRQPGGPVIDECKHARTFRLTLEAFERLSRDYR